MGTYQLGVDLGTTYTGAAVRRDGISEIVSLGTRSATMPTVVVAAPEGGLVVGEAAERRALELPERTARQFKRRLGDTTPILLGGTPYSPQALLGAVLADVVTRVTAEQGAAPERIALTHPANWGPYKRELVRQVAELAGLHAADVSTLTEPAAAALHYASQAHLEPGSTVAVYDLGGGTFDAAVVRIDVGGAELLGEPTGIEHLGGIDFDAAVFEHVAGHLGNRLDPILTGDDADAALLWRLREECTRAKEALSTDADAVVGVALPDGFVEVRITRSEFEELVRPALAPTGAALRRAVESAGLQPDDLAGVLLVGGSSRIPLVSEVVAAELGRPVLLDTHPKHAVALGAAAHAAGAEVGEVVAVIGGEPELVAAEAAARSWWRAPAAAAVVVLLAVAGLVAGLVLADDDDPDELAVEHVDDEATTTTSADASTTTTDTTATTLPIDTSTSIQILEDGTAVSHQVDETGRVIPGTETPVTVTPNGQVVTTAPPAPTATATTAAPTTTTAGASTPGAPTPATTSNAVAAQFSGLQASQVRTTVEWSAPGATGNRPLSEFRVYRTLMTLNGQPEGAREHVATAGAGATSIDVVSPTNDQQPFNSWFRWEVTAVNTAGLESAPAVPSVDVQSTVGEYEWNAYFLLRALGLPTVNGGPIDCGADADRICSQSVTSGSRAQGQSVTVRAQSA